MVNHFRPSSISGEVSEKSAFVKDPTDPGVNGLFPQKRVDLASILRIGQAKASVLSKRSILVLTIDAKRNKKSQFRIKNKVNNYYRLNANKAAKGNKISRAKKAQNI